jgi:hypothetical protein
MWKEKTTTHRYIYKNLSITGDYGFHPFGMHIAGKTRGLLTDDDLFHDYYL